MQTKTTPMKKADAHSPELPQLSDKAEAILKGAIQEFLVHGYAATTMDRVSATAGVSKATVYNHFQDKESLFSALVERLTQKDYQEALNPDAPEFWEGEAAEVLRRLAIAILAKVKHQPEFRDLVRLIIGESGRFPVLAKIFVRNIDKKIYKHLAQYLESRDELQLPDPEAAARVFIGALVHFVILQDMLQAQDIMPMESDRLIDTLVYLLTLNQTEKSADRYAGTRQKSSRRKRSASGKFEPDYQREPKRLRSLRLTDTAWEQLDAIARTHQLTRSEAIELFARNGKLDLD